MAETVPVTQAAELMQEFYLSSDYDPKAARPADTVQAAIAFTLARIASQTASPTIGEEGAAGTGPVPSTGTRFSGRVNGTDCAAPTGDYGGLIERLREQARAASGALKMLAGAKTSRQADRDDYPELKGVGYSWPTPEQMTEWIAADALSELLRELAAIPCQTRGAEDLEPGCCATCRARAALTPEPSHDQ